MLKKTLVLLLCVASCWITVGCFQSSDLEDLEDDYIEDDKVKSYYETLGLPYGANYDKIKKVWKQRARKTHPDKNPGNAKASAKFIEVNEAHAALKALNEAGRLPAAP